MSTRKALNIFTVFLLIFFLSTAAAFAGGKQEKPEDTEKNAQESLAESTDASSGSGDTNTESSDLSGSGTPIQSGGSLPAATVNGRPISQKDFEQLLQAAQYQYMQQGMQIQGAQLEQLKQMVLESLIDDEIIYQAALDEGYSATEAEIDKAVESTRGQFESEEAYQQALQRDGLDEAQIREMLAEQLTRNKYEQEKFIDPVNVEADEIQAFYDENPDQFKQPFQYRSSHILVQVAEDASEEEKAAAKDKIEDVKQRIENGEEFSEVARELSDCPSSSNGGDLDYQQRGALVPAFEEAALALEIGEISDVVETRFGYHIIKLTDRKEEETVAFEDVKDQIENYLMREKYRDIRSSFIRERKPETSITRNALNG